MSRFSLLAFSAMFILPAIVYADIPPPTGTKYFDPRVRFVGIERHGDHVFFLHYETGGDQRFMAPTMAEVKNDAELTLKNTGRYISRVLLCALPRPAFEKLKPREFIDAKTPGVITAAVSVPSNLGPKLALRGPLTEYRVAIKDGKMTVATATKRADAGPIPGWAIGVALALSLAGFGVWAARRRMAW